MATTGTHTRTGHDRLTPPRRIDPLVAGILAGPALAAVSFAQIPFRPGFDMTRHAFSFLLIGPGAWAQVSNYLLAGALYATAGHGCADGWAARLAASPSSRRVAWEPASSLPGCSRHLRPSATPKERRPGRRRR
jgi:hypothetical protein